MYYKKRKDYLIGADVMRPGEAEALRDMCDPKRFGK
jgi:Zn-dependent metalloprotease